MGHVYRVASGELHRQGRQVSRAAKRGCEVCGLVVRSGNGVRLVPVRNSARRLGGFEMVPSWWRIALRANGIAAGQVIGTYHSHPASPAEPGEGDIAGAWNGALMLIFAQWGEQVRLWQVRGGCAFPARLVRCPATVL